MYEFSIWLVAVILENSLHVVPSLDVEEKMENDSFSGSEASIVNSFFEFLKTRGAIKLWPLVSRTADEKVLK